MDVKVQISSDVINDINDYCKNVAKYTVISFRDELATSMKSEIDRFYNSYHPKRYRRHYNLYNTFKKHYVNSHNTIYYGGIVLDPSHMEDGIYNEEPENVYNATLVFGFHGIPFNAPAVISPSPIDVILDKYDEMLDNAESYGLKGAEMAQNISYRVLSFG